jgi:hypothetical protein
VAEIAHSLNAIELDERELWFLLSQYGPGVIVGTGDPYQGWTMEKATRASEEAFRSLLRRGILLPASEHEVFVPTPITKALQACHQAENTLIVQFQESGGSLVRRFFHFFDGMILEMAGTGNARYRLGFVPSAAQLTEEMSALLRADSTAITGGHPLVLEADQFDRIRRLCANGAVDAATELLSEATVETELAERLVADLAKPLASGAFVAIKSRRAPSGNEVAGFAILEGSHSIWIMEPREQVSTAGVQLTAASPQVLRDRFLELLPA